MEFAFVSVTGSGATNAADVHTVRSHSMRGIHKKEDSRRSRQAARRKHGITVAGVQPSRTSDARSDDAKRQMVTSNLIDSPETCRPGALQRSSTPRQEAVGAVDAQRMNLSPPMSISERWLVPMACCESADSRELLVKFDWFKRSMYPAHHYVDFAPVQDDEWPHEFANNHSFVHSVLFTSAAIEDYLLRRPFSHTTSLHLQRTLRGLNAAITGGHAGVTVATGLVVMSLCIVASIYGNGDTLSIHLAGLKRMSAMKNKLKQMSLHPLISLKMDALDLAVYMCNGSPPQSAVFGPMSWNPIYTLSKPGPEVCFPGVQSEAIGHISDGRLWAVFWDLQQLFRQVDQYFPSTGRLQGATFREVTYSVQSRLVQLEGRSLNTLEESLCLGMIALLSTNFRIPTRRLEYAYLRNELIKTCDSFEPAAHTERELRMWLIMVSAMSVFEPKEPWIRAQWSQCMENSSYHWSDVRTIMSRLIWSHCMHDDLGRETFDALCRD